MSELDDFLKWGAQLDRDTKDSFNNRIGRFPYGTLSYWINEYKRAKENDEPQSGV